MLGVGIYVCKNVFARMTAQDNVNLNTTVEILLMKNFNDIIIFVIKIQKLRPLSKSLRCYYKIFKNLLLLRLSFRIFGYFILLNLFSIRQVRLKRIVIKRVHNNGKKYIKQNICKQMKIRKCKSLSGGIYAAIFS